MCERVFGIPSKPRESDPSMKEILSLGHDGGMRWETEMQAMFSRHCRCAQKQTLSHSHSSQPHPTEGTHIQGTHQENPHNSAQVKSFEMQSHQAPTQVHPILVQKPQQSYNAQHSQMQPQTNYHQQSNLSQVAQPNQQAINLHNTPQFSAQFPTRHNLQLNLQPNLQLNSRQFSEEKTVEIMGSSGKSSGIGVHKGQSKNPSTLFSQHDIHGVDGKMPERVITSANTPVPSPIAENDVTIGENEEKELSKVIELVRSQVNTRNPKEIYLTFRWADGNADGLISPPDFRDGLSLLGAWINDRSCRSLIRRFRDVNGGGVDYRSFASHVLGIDIPKPNKPASNFEETGLALRTEDAVRKAQHAWKERRNDRQREKVISRTSRWLPDTTFRSYLNKPCFHNYGRTNTNSVAGGIIWGDYLLTHNINPNQKPNRPPVSAIRKSLDSAIQASRQVYPSADVANLRRSFEKAENPLTRPKSAQDSTKKSNPTSRSTRRPNSAQKSRYKSKPTPSHKSSISQRAYAQAFDQTHNTENYDSRLYQSWDPNASVMDDYDQYLETNDDAFPLAT